MQQELIYGFIDLFFLRGAVRLGVWVYCFGLGALSSVGFGSVGISVESFGLRGCAGSGTAQAVRNRLWDILNPKTLSPLGARRVWRLWFWAEESRASPSFKAQDLGRGYEDAFCCA